MAGSGCVNMAAPIVFVTWKNHANELTTVCNSMLENEFCVDCTIVAEGKSLKAHRLILSACSPYFHMLFSEQREKHSIVIITDTLFHTLKTVIHFMYYGKTEIPANQFEEFWELAVSLQIKGLDNSLRKDWITDIGSSGDRNGIRCPSIVHRGICEIGSSWTREEDGFSNSSQQCPFHLQYGYTDTGQADSSVLVEGCSDLVHSRAMIRSQRDYERCPVQNDCDVSRNPVINVKQEPLFSECEISATKTEVLDHQSSSLHEGPEVLINSETSVKIEPLFSECEISAAKTKGLSHERCPRHEDPEVLIDTEISVKHEPLYPEIEFLVSRNTNECMKQEISENLRSETNDGHSLSLNHKLDQYSCGRESFDALGNSGLIAPMQHVTCSPCELSPEGSDSWPPEHSVRESEKTDVDSEASVGAQDVGEMNVESESPLVQNLNLSSENILPDEEQATQRRGERRRQSNPSLAPAQQPEASAPPGTRQQRTRTGERPCTCGVCGKAFFKQRNLTAHMRTHTGERLCQCDVCGKTFTHVSVLTIHMRTHTGERPYKCDVCGKAFSHVSHLVVHKRSHTGERPYACDVCEKAFFTPNNLLRHKRKHTGERPYSCDVCGKVYSRSHLLIVHKRTHTGERPYSCDACGKTFSQSHNLIVHKRTHTGERPYSCDVCGKVYSRSHHLIVHKRTHTGERPYSCDVCGKAYTQSHNLISHKRTHTEERPYSCDVCEETFALANLLTEHMRTHTGESPYECDV